MNFSLYFLSKNLLKMFSFLLVFVFSAILKAQTKENPELLRKHILSSKDDVQRIPFLLRLSEFYIVKPYELKKDLDSAAILNKEAMNLSLKRNNKLGIGKSMLLDARIDKERGRWDIATAKMKKSINYFLTHKMQEQSGEAYNELSYMYNNDPEYFDTKVELKKKALLYFNSSHTVLKKALVLMDLAELYSIKDDPEKTSELLKQSLAAYQSVKYKNVQTVYKLLSLAEVQKGDLKEALLYANLAEKTSEEVGDHSVEMSSIYNQVGLVYYYLHQDQKAIDYWEKALVVAKKNKNNPFIRTVSSNISTMVIRHKKFKEGIEMIKEYKRKYPINDKEFEMRENYILFHTYTTLKQLKNAEYYYKKLIDYYGEDGGKGNSQTSILLSFSMYHLYKKDYDAFYKSVKLLNSLSSKTGNDLLSSQNFMLWFKADSTRGKYLDAIKHYQLYKKHLDSVFNGEKSRQINSLQIQFETEKKDKNIKLLKHQQKLQEAKIQNEKVIRDVFIGSLVALVLFLAILYNSFRIKKKKNKQLELKRKQIDEQNEQLKKLLAEKEWLLKEIHHRVKNNLQIVISLLNTQSAYLDNEDAVLAIQNSQHRMHAMSLIHQKLYQSDNLSTIDMSWYIYELVAYIKECYSSEKKINFTMSTEKVLLDVSQAVPMGLIVNEAINNTVKYAFPDDRRGEVVVSFKSIKDDFYELIISDNGIGLPENFDIDETESLGMNLMRGLTDQLDGTFILENKNGLTIKITFKKNKEMEADQIDA